MKKLSLKKLKKPVGLIQGIALGLAASSLFTWAAVNLPHTFSSGQTISSAQVNANFTALANKVNEIDTKFIGTLPGDLNITCAGTPTYPDDYQFINWNFHNGGSGTTMTIPSDGLYKLESGMHSISGYADVMLVIDGVQGTVNYQIKEHLLMTAGQTVKIAVTCNDKYGTETTLVASKTFFLLKKM